MTRPTRIAQTSTEVKKLHKRKSGNALPERQQRQLERAAELEERARAIRDREDRSKAAKKKREERERKEAELRRMDGVGLATQMIGYSHTQAQLKKGMEAFLGYKKREDERQMEVKVTNQSEAAVEEAIKEPWDDDEDTFVDLPLNPSTRSEEFDDDLDDDTLLEIHNQIMSDPVEEPNKDVEPQQIASTAPVIPSPKMATAANEDMDFIRIHGPINKMVDSILDGLPDPLIELLSQDSAVNPTLWNPSPALLHKLNPFGLPPHRLRVKVGCIVSLLRDLNSSSQLSKSQHLRILRVEQERLECLVLDGQLEGTKAFLIKVTFTAKHRNEENLPFRRIQFPVQVSKDFVAPRPSRQTCQPGFKKPTLPGRPAQPLRLLPKRTISTPKSGAQTGLNPSFKLPGTPASKLQPPSLSYPKTQPPASLLDGWDDFLDTSTQIARDLSCEPSSPVKAPPNRPIQIQPLAAPSASVSNSMPPFSTQDFDFSLEDLKDVPEEQNDKVQSSNALPEKVSDIPTPSNVPSGPDKQKSVEVTKSTRPANTVAPPQGAVGERAFSRTLNKPTNEATPKVKDFSKRVTTDDEPASKRPKLKTAQPVNTKDLGGVDTESTSNNVSGRCSTSNFQAKPVPSFSEFGLSTQEAVSFFDDNDDLDFGSPPIVV